MSFSERKNEGSDQNAITHTRTYRRNRVHRRTEDRERRRRKRQRVDTTRLPNVPHSNVHQRRPRQAVARSTEERSSSRVCSSTRGSRRQNSSNRKRYFRRRASSPERSLGPNQNPCRSIPRSRPQLSRFCRRGHQGSTLRRLKRSTDDARRSSLRVPGHRAAPSGRRLLSVSPRPRNPRNIQVHAETDFSLGMSMPIPLVYSDEEKEGFSEFNFHTSNPFSRTYSRDNATRRPSFLEASSARGWRNNSMAHSRIGPSHCTCHKRSNRLDSPIMHSRTNRNSICSRGIRDRERHTLSGQSFSRRNHFRPSILVNVEHKDFSYISDESSDDYPMDAYSIFFSSFANARAERIRRHMRRYEEDFCRRYQADAMMSAILSGYESSGGSLSGFLNQQEIRGARFDQINKLPIWKFKVKPKHTHEVEVSCNQKSCCICLDDFEHDDCLRTLQCLHFFHRKCIDKWLLKNRTCPICKFDITTSGSSF